MLNLDFYHQILKISYDDKQSFIYLMQTNVYFLMQNLLDTEFVTVSWEYQLCQLKIQIFNIVGFIMID